MAKTILKVNNLSKQFRMKSGFFSSKKDALVKAVSNVSLEVSEGETLGIVGESGCGKTTLGRCIVRGIDASSGELLYTTQDGRQIDFLRVNKKEYKGVRKEIQMIFQDPYSSLDPRMTIYDIISEPLKANFKLSKAEIEERVVEMAQKTGLNVSYLKRYPHAFSGGQRQRIGIARALVTRPKLIVCDEAVSALDVSIQAQIINLLTDLQKELGMAYIFISHDLSVVHHISDKVAVMYLGEVVEYATTEELYSNPKHPYTEALLSAVPKPDPTIKMERIVLKGEVPNPANPPSGCHFHPRCAYKTDKCEAVKPALMQTSTGHQVACHYAEELSLTGISVQEIAAGKEEESYEEH